MRNTSPQVLQRLSAAAAPTAVCVAIAAVAGYPRGDWEIASDAGGLLLDGHLDVYTQMPKAQMGPLALMLAGGLPGWAYLAAACALLPVLLVLATAQQEMTRRLHLLLVVGGLLLAWPWAALGVQGHLDEAIVVLGAIGMAVSLRRATAPWLVIAFLVAIAAKPTAAVLIPLLFLRSWRVGAIGVVGTTIIWAPFFLSDPAGFLAAGSGPGDLWPGSLHALLGAEPHSGFPDWVRPVQLLGGLGLCFALAKYRGVAAAVAGVFVFRALLEPGVWNYYGSTIAAAGLLFDVRHWRWPVMTGLGFLSFATVLSTPVSEAGGHMRLAALTTALLVVVLARPDHDDDVAPSPSVDRAEPATTAQMGGTTDPQMAILPNSPPSP